MMVADTSQKEPPDRLSEREVAILRLMADGLSNQEIADQLFLALTTVKWYIRQINDKLDTHSRTQTVARAHQLKLIGNSDTVRVAQAEEHEPPENPYKGLHAFGEADSADFYGRENLSQQLVEWLAHHTFLGVVGPSGSGKSSVVNAGLIPALRRGALAGSEKWLIAEMLPGTHPLDELEIALQRLAPNGPSSLMEHLRRDERGLLRAAQLILPDVNHYLLLVIDQFEEVFALVNSSRERDLFMNLICAAVTDPRSPIRVVITLRADFYDRPLLHPTFGDLMERGTRLVLPMQTDEVERAITRPSTQVGVEIEPGVVSAIIADINQQPGALPLLQYALTELFDHCQGSNMTLDAYRIIGGMTGALARRADALYVELDHNGQETARQMFLRLVTLGEVVEDTRRRVTQTELLSLSGDPVTMDNVIQTFAAYRLLTLDHDPRTHEATVEVAHEAILREWERLRLWLDESRADVRMQRLLAHDTKEWNDAQQDTSYLLTGSRLAQFEEWAAAAGLALTTAERAYLDASITERERLARIEQERQAREKRLEHRSRNILGVLVVVLLLATLGAFGLTGVTVNQSNIAQRNEAEARSLALASAAQLALNEGNTDLAIQQAEAALEIGDNALARRILDQAAFAPRTPLLFQETGSFIPAALAPQETELTFVMVASVGPPNPFAVTMMKGMEDACAFLNASCRWLSNPIQDIEPEQMVGHWEEALALNPDGIGTTIWDADLIRSSVEQAAEEGIPVVVFDIARNLGDDRSLSALLYIGSDEYIGGQTNARRVFAEANADGVTIRRGVCTNQVMGNPPLDARCAGVASVFDQEGVPLDEIPISAHNSYTAAREIGAYFADHPETNAIFMLGPNTASALNLYFRGASLEPRQLYATTHDSSPETFQMIRDGYLLQTIDRQPYMQGFQTIVSLYLYRQYGIRPSGFINTSSVVDLNNVDYVSQLIELSYR